MHNQKPTFPCTLSNIKMNVEAPFPASEVALTDSEPVDALGIASPKIAYYHHARPEILDIVPRSACRVLDVGCGAGGFSASLKARQQVEVHGVELVAHAAELARGHLDQVWNSPIEEALPKLPDGYYDCIIVADVLEHLLDPWAVLINLRSKLAAGGKIIASIPNIQYWGVLSDLIQGKWIYLNEGILDRTHLRFFTRKSVEELFWGAGLHIVSLGSKNGDAVPPASLLNKLKKLGFAAEKLEQDGQVFQFLIEAEIPPVRDAPKITIVILNWNGKEDTLECLASVGQLDYPNYEVIVVDNGSTDDSVDAISKQYPDITLLQTGANLGYAGGNNVGIRWVLDHDADFIFLLNNDTIVSPQLLASLVSAANRHPDAAFLGARLFYLDQPERIWFDGARWNPDKNYFEYPGQGMPTTALSSADHETDYVCGAALFIRTEIIRQVGLMDERYFLVWEEVDWCYRARHAGLRNIVVPDAVVWHKVGPSFGGEDSPLRTYFDIRNALVWSWRYAGLSTWQGVLSRSLSRALPKFTVSPDKRYPLPKRFVWALLNYFRAFSRHRNPKMWVIRRAIRDYLLRKLGDCPAIVRKTSQEWAKQHSLPNRPQ